jgi:hypothetical protein
LKKCLNNPTFAALNDEKVNVNNPATHINDAESKYDSYDPAFWEKAYFDKYSGGFNVYHKDHNFVKRGGGGDAEKVVGKLLAQFNGKQIEFLPEKNYQKCPDIYFDNKTWDIKLINIANENTIRNYIKDARKAGNAIFYWTGKDKLEELKNAVLRSIGYFKKKNELHLMPDIYYINKEGVLKSIFMKPS